MNPHTPRDGPLLSRRTVLMPGPAFRGLAPVYPSPAPPKPGYVLASALHAASKELLQA